MPENSPAGVCGSEKWPWLPRALGSRCGLGRGAGKGWELWYSKSHYLGWEVYDSQGLGHEETGSCLLFRTPHFIANVKSLCQYHVPVT